jgi:RNA polymerase sigma-70 factor (ECF subfamily)
MTDARAALLAAYLERRDDLLRFFTVRLRSAAAAEDLVQDIYLRIAAVDRGVEVRNAAAYLYRAGSNLMLDKIRDERRATTRDHDWREAHRTVQGGEEVAEEPAADDAVAARQQLAAIAAIVCELSEKTQRVFRMHKFEGLSHAEVAQALGISRSAVEKHCMAALKRLAERLP